MTHRTQSFAHEFSSLDNLSFSAVDYSRLKFGCDVTAKRFGHELAQRFFFEHSVELMTQQCVVIPSPYNHVENAATVMAKHFVDHLNHLLVNANGTHVEWSTIHRKVSYINDYGFLTKDKRRELIDGDQFFLNKQFLEGKALIFVDDVFITGTHEDKLVDVLAVNGIDNPTFFVYYAKYANDGGADIEAALNFSGITSASEFVELSKEPGHHMIVRPIKFLLRLPPSTFVDVVAELDEHQVTAMYYGALGEGYYAIPAYHDNFQHLRKYLNFK